VTVSAVAKAVVQAAGTPLPKLELVWCDKPSTPLWRTRHIRTGEALTEVCNCIVQLFPIRDDPRLRACPRTNLGLTGSRSKIRITLCISEASNGASDSNLSVKIKPSEDERSMGIPLELGAL
jgi:hypothetical protein